MARRIAISAIGTMGDVQPFVALAVALEKRGYDVVIGTCDDFEEFVTGRGIAFRNLGTDMQAFLKQNDFDNAMSKSTLLYAPGLLREGQKILKTAAHRTWEMSQDADAIIFHNNTTFCIDMAEALGIPAIMTAFQPLNPTEEFPYFEYSGRPVDPMLTRLNRQPFARSFISIDPIINKLTYMVQTAQQTYYDLPRDRLRRKLLGLKSLKRGGFKKNSRGERLTALHAYSAVLSPAPLDWPDNNVTTGFWRLEDDTGWEPSPEFSAFLDAGEPPIYLGFGSMPFGAQRNTEIITRALRLWGGRAVIGKGWGGLRVEDLPDTVFIIDKAPHTKLFEYVKAVVHHGGAGTTYAGLYAGKPTFCVPQFFDQPYWGQRVHQLGCGPVPVRLRKLTPGILANALNDLSTNTFYERSAEAVRDRLVLEDGTGRAVDVIEEVLDAFPVAGNDNNFPASAAL